jgi:hypothetical protein
VLDCHQAIEFFQHAIGAVPHLNLKQPRVPDRSFHALPQRRIGRKQDRLRQMNPKNSAIFDDRGEIPRLLQRR